MLRVSLITTSKCTSRLPCIRQYLPPEDWPPGGLSASSHLFYILPGLSNHGLLPRTGVTPGADRQVWGRTDDSRPIRGLERLSVYLPVMYVALALRGAEI